MGYLQVQERINGYTIEKFGNLFKKGYPEGYGEREPEEKEKLQGLVLAWLAGVGIKPGERVEEKEKALTQLVLGRILTAYLHFHHRCGVVHDDM